MKYLAICLTITISVNFLELDHANAATTPKVMVLDFQLNDLTDIPNAPEELERISYLTKIYKES